MGFSQRRKTLGRLIVVVLIATASTTRFRFRDENSWHHEGTKAQQHITTEPLLLLEKKNRSIVFVHVGKSGGMTFRSATAAACRKSLKCHQRFFQNNQHNLLAIQTRSFFHLNHHDEDAIQRATSFVVPFRNPVDRIVSAYRFSHPENCLSSFESEDKAVQNVTATNGPQIRACVAKDQLLQSPTKLRHVYQECFPSPAMENFAQSVMSPWNDDHLNHTTTKDQKRSCRRMARDMVMGRDDNHHRHPGAAAAPQMQCNFEHYAQRSFDLYPDREVFGIRTEREWEDMVALDQLLGGSGIFRRNGAMQTHGSSRYAPSPLSVQAYHKLSCVLEREIGIYLRTLHRRVLNLDVKTKQRHDEQLREKCGVHNTKNTAVAPMRSNASSSLASWMWDAWQAECREKLEADRKVLYDD